MQYIEGAVTTPSRWFKTPKDLRKGVPPIHNKKWARVDCYHMGKYRLRRHPGRPAVSSTFCGSSTKMTIRTGPCQQCTRLRTVLTEVNWCVSFSSAVALLKLLRAKQIPSPRDWKIRNSASAGLSTRGLRGFGWECPSRGVTYFS